MCADTWSTDRRYQPRISPLAEQAWFQAMLEHTGRSMELAFAIAAVPTFAIQSPNAVCIFGIGLLGAGALTVEQTLMVFYGADIGSGLPDLICCPAALQGAPGGSRWYKVLYDVLTSLVLVPLLYVKLHFGVPLAVAVLERLPFEAEINLAIFYILTSLLALPMLLGTVDLCAAALKRRCPVPCPTPFPATLIHGARADEDPLARVQQEHAQVVQNFAVYFDAVREGWRVAPLREASCSLLDDIGGFLGAVPLRRHAGEVEARKTLRNQQRLLMAHEEALGRLRTLLGARAPATELRSLLCRRP